MKKAALLKNYRKEILLACLFLITLFFGFNSALVESLYSTGLYIFISNFLRIITGKIPFSIGDFLYGATFVLLVYHIARVFTIWRRKTRTRQQWKMAGRKFLRIVLIIYLIFQWLWGLNYHRLGSAYELGIEPGVYTKFELVELADTLNSRLYDLIPKITPADSVEWYNFTAMKNRCIADYRQVAGVYPFINYNHPSIKKMVIGSIGGYGGFSGYLNPFTGEAQLNGNVPPFLRPYITCHEIGHQLGFAAEEEANMIGYIAARQSSNPAVRYSAYHDLMTYASNELYHADSNAYKLYVQRLPLLAKLHSRQARDYYASFRSPVQKVVNQWYNLYLKANSQDKGVKSYNYITAWLIAYAKKYGWEKI